VSLEADGDGGSAAVAVPGDDQVGLAGRQWFALVHVVTAHAPPTRASWPGAGQLSGVGHGVGRLAASVEIGDRWRRGDSPARTDYDAPRRTQTEDTDDDSLQALNARRTDTQSSAVDVDETDLNEALELPGADLSNLSEDELTVRVVPQQADEFTCASCFLVHHRSRLARETRGQIICRDCA
jgi:hypothetical protein